MDKFLTHVIIWNSTHFPDFIILFFDIEFFAHLLYPYDNVTPDDIHYGGHKAILESREKLQIKIVEMVKSE